MCDIGVAKLGRQRLQLWVNAMYKSAPLSVLRVGVELGSPIQDQQNRLLLAAGIEITQDLLAKLRKWGVQNVSVEEKNFARLTAFAPSGKVNKAPPRHSTPKIDGRSDVTDELDDLIGASSTSDFIPSQEPFSDQVQSHGASRYDKERMDRIFDHHQATSNHVSELVDKLESGEAVSAEALHDISQGVVKQAVEDMDLFVCMGINPAANNSIFQHSTNRLGSPAAAASSQACCFFASQPDSPPSLPTWGCRSFNKEKHFLGTAPAIPAVRTSTIWSTTTIAPCPITS